MKYRISFIIAAALSAFLIPDYRSSLAREMDMPKQARELSIGLSASYPGFLQQTFDTNGDGVEDMIFYYKEDPIGKTRAWEGQPSIIWRDLNGDNRDQTDGILQLPEFFKKRDDKWMQYTDFIGEEIDI